MISILMSICLVAYIILLIISCKKKENRNIRIATLLFQCGIWTLLAVDNWQNSHMITRIVYVVIIALSFVDAIYMMVKK